MASAELDLDWAERREDALLLRVNVGLYSEEALFRACYAFTDRCYLFLTREPPDCIVVRFRKRQPTTDLARMCQEFANELVNQRVRIDLAKATQDIRRLIVAQAFSGTSADGQ